MTWFLTTKIGRALAFTGVVLLGLVTFGASQRRYGRRQADMDALEDGAERQEDGREAVADLRDADRGRLVGSLRENDDDWK